jgi:hypothetical protein
VVGGGGLDGRTGNVSESMIAGTASSKVYSGRSVGTFRAVALYTYSCPSGYPLEYTFAEPGTEFISPVLWFMRTSGVQAS